MRRCPPWLALDADGVIQQGNFLTSAVLKGNSDAPLLCENEFLDLHKRHLTNAGFEPALSSLIGLSSTTDILKKFTSIAIDRAALDVVDEYRARFAGIALATNQVAERLSEMLREYPRGFFDTVVASCHIGSSKPSGEFFAGLSSSLRVAPSQIFFVDDRADNIDAAATAGLKAYLSPRLGGASEMVKCLQIGTGGCYLSSQ